MLSKFIIDTYGTLIEVGLWIFLVVAIATGFTVGDVWGAILSVLIWMVASVFFVGPVLVLLDIRGKVESIESTLQTSRSNQPG